MTGLLAEHCPGGKSAHLALAPDEINWINLAHKYNDKRALFTVAIQGDLFGRARQGKSGIEIRAAIAEKAPSRPVPTQEVEIKFRGDDALLVPTKFGNQIAPMVCDEGRAIKSLSAAGIIIPGLEPGAI